MEMLYDIQQRDVLLQVPLRQVSFQSLHAFVATRDGGSPFIETITDYLDGSCTTYRGSRLESFFAQCRPQTAVNFMQLSGSATNWLYQMPAIASVLPWLDKDPEYAMKAVEYWTAQDSREHGRGLGIKDGCQHFGPVSREKGELEFERLINVAKSVREHGFRVDPSGNDNIWVFLLLHDDKYHFHQEGGGNHRLAALAALNFETATVQIRTQNIARRREAKWWPMVMRGWLSEQEALMVFDRIFAGKHAD